MAKTHPIVPIARIAGGDIIEFVSALHQIMVNWQDVTIVLPGQSGLNELKGFTENLNGVNNERWHCSFNNGWLYRRKASDVLCASLRCWNGNQSISCARIVVSPQLREALVGSRMQVEAV